MKNALTPFANLRRRLIGSTLVLFAAVFLGGCATEEKPLVIQYRAVVYYDATPAELDASKTTFVPGVTAQKIQMAGSKTTYHINPVPVLGDVEFHATQALARTNDPTGIRPDHTVLTVRLKDKPARDFYLRAVNRHAEGGRRLFLVVNNVPVGFLDISDELKTGILDFILDLPADNFEDLKQRAASLQVDLNKTIVALRELEKSKK